MNSLHDALVEALEHPIVDGPRARAKTRQRRGNAGKAKCWKSIGFRPFSLARPSARSELHSFYVRRVRPPRPNMLGYWPQCSSRAVFAIG